MNLPNSFATKRLKKKFQWNPYSILSTGYPVMNTATSRPNAINNIGAIFKIIFGRFIERPCIEFPILFHKVRSAWEKIGLGWKSSCVFRISGSKCIRCNEGANTSVHCTCTKGFWLANRRRGHLEINCKNTNLKWTVRDFVAEKVYWPIEKKRIYTRKIEIKSLSSDFAWAFCLSTVFVFTFFDLKFCSSIRYSNLRYLETIPRYKVFKFFLSVFIKCQDPDK